MGKMVNGVWTTEWYTPDTAGRFVRPDTVFRQSLGEEPFKAEAGRYHLYVAWACPWAHRALIMRKLKGLEHAIDVSVVSPYMGEGGWNFSQAEGSTGDQLHGKDFLRDVYATADPHYTGRVTVPVLWDKSLSTIVNNESRDLLRMFDHNLSEIAGDDTDYAPAGQRAQIDDTIDEIYQPINNGVYRTGFAQTQQAYDEAVHDLFDKLDELEDRLSQQEYLVADSLSEADICLYTTLIRFDLVYYIHFKCSYRRISDYKYLSKYLQRLYQNPAFFETTNFEHIKNHYFWSHETINPYRIIPYGPELQLT